MQYAWGGNVGVQLMHEVADNVAGPRRRDHQHPAAAQQLGIADGDLVEIATPKRRVRGRAVLRQGIRPDTLLLIGQFDHWATPLAKDLGMPSLNTLADDVAGPHRRHRFGRRHRARRKLAKGRGA